MDDNGENRPAHEHDWHSSRYVAQWIERDVSRDSERRLILRRMLEFAESPRDAALEVIDIGAGYGVVTEEVLAAFPNARVTMLDYSDPMFAEARRRLGAHLDALRFVTGDLSRTDWIAAVGGPFDLAVSSIAIHNLRESRLIASAYAGVRKVLKPGAIFLDCDLVSFSGGLDAHLQWLCGAGFSRVECPWYQAPLAILVAHC
jgi:ubiquinone/menaquinone biosynthesis C-methylase UbiE